MKAALLRRLAAVGSAIGVMVSIAAALAGCAAGAPPAPNTVLDDEARTHPERHLLVTLRNQPAAPSPHAASTLRGYDGLGGYRAGAQALQAARRLAAAYQLREVAAWPIELLGVHCLVFALPPAARRDELLAALQRDPEVESAQPLLGFALHGAITYNDPYAPLQANLQTLGVPAVQPWSRGSGVRIAVVDTGIDTGHPDFERQLPAVRDFVADGRSTAEGHGTAVAGLIAAVPNNGIGIAGIAPQATLLPLRACWTAADGGGACNSFTLAQALVAAIDARVQLVNLSLGGPEDALLRRIVERALARGIVVVGALPPGGRREGFPTAIDGVIAVDRAGRAERLPRVLYAPGNEVFTLTPRGRYDAASGSSIAAAAVSGVAALLLAQRPGLSGSELEAALRRSAEGGGPAGSIHACRALRQLQPAARCADEAEDGGRGSGLARQQRQPSSP
jgi:hypothetical protein